MIIFDIPNFILSFTVMSAGLLMLALTVILCLIASSIITKVIRQWHQKER